MHGSILLAKFLPLTLAQFSDIVQSSYNYRKYVDIYKKMRYNNSVR